MEQEIASQTPLDEVRAQNTTAERLKEIANRALHGDLRRYENEIVEGVLGNPNAPADLLAELAPRNWPAFFKNPSGPLLPLEMPDLLGRFSEDAKRNLLRLTGVPDWLLRWLAGDEVGSPQIALEARLHVGVAGEVGREWEPRLRRALKRVAAVATPEEQAEQIDMVELGLAPEWVAGEESAPAGANTTGSANDAGTFGELSESLWEKAQQILNASSPGWEVYQFARAYPDAALKLAAHPQTPQHLLALMTRYSKKWPLPLELRLAVAENPGARAPALRGLIEDKDSSVRRMARRHRNAPQDAMDQSRAAALNAASSPLCRLIALLHAQTPQQRVEAAANSHFWTERLASALRGREYLKRLSQDGNAFVRAVARARVGGARVDFRL